MNIRPFLLAGLLGVPAVVGSALAIGTTAPTGNAVKEGNHDAVASLPKTPVKDATAPADTTAALLQAAQRNDVQTIDALLKTGVNANAVNDYGATALYAAAGNTDPAATTTLLAAGANPNAALLSGETPLMEAAHRGNLATVRALLKSHANPNVQESNGGQTALMWAASEEHPDVTEALVKGGADIHLRSKKGLTALMFAAQSNDAASARILIGAGASANESAPAAGWTSLILASAMSNTDVAKVLLDNKADPNAVDASGFTALHYAARKKDAVDIMKALLQHGANPNVRLNQKEPKAKTTTGISLQGATPLALAAEVNNFEAVKVLADGGADPLIPTEKGTTPLMLAAGCGTDVHRPRPGEERATAIKTVTFLVEHGAKVNDVGQFGWAAIHGASFQGLNDVVKYLASKGANLDLKDDLGQTPLTIASIVLTKGGGEKNLLRIPDILRKDTADLLLQLGATPIEKSGVVVAIRRDG